MDRDRSERSAYRTEKIPTASGSTPTTERIRVEGGASSVGRMGMWLLIASLGVLFAAAIVGYLIIRFRAPEWPPPGSPAFPFGIWIGTGLLVVLSALLVRAKRLVAGDKQAAASRLEISICSKAP